MRTFTILWLGQFVSTIGSYMSDFGLTLWVWEVTHSATALTTIGVCGQVSRVLITPFAGMIVDRYNRQSIIKFSDIVAASATLMILLLYLTQHLQIWHLYLFGAVNGGFGQLQSLAYSTSVTLMVSPAQYTRASSMESALHYGSAIFAPALAGILYGSLGLVGIFAIDIVSFGVAIATLCAVVMPQPPSQMVMPWSRLLQTTGQQMIAGLRDCWQQPSLRFLLLITLLFWLVHDLGGAIYEPMILARSGGNAQVLAGTSLAAGLGGVIGAIGLSVWGGFPRRTQGLIYGMIGAGLSKLLFGLGRAAWVWLPSQFCSSLHFPLLSSSETAIWMARVAADRQGQVFAANSLLLQLSAAGAMGLAGLLADRLFEPMMMGNRAIARALQPLLGGGSGSGMALLYVLCALSMIGVGLWGLSLPQLRQLEDSGLVSEAGSTEDSSPFV